VRSGGLDFEGGASDAVVIRASRDRVSAGQTLVGEVLGAPRPVTIALVRIEQTPSGERLRSCQEAIAIAASKTDVTQRPPPSSSRFPTTSYRAPAARDARCPTHFALAPLGGAVPVTHRDTLLPNIAANSRISDGR
jgi:hypothetical protein